LKKLVVKPATVAFTSGSDENSFYYNEGKNMHFLVAHFAIGF
jgi:hypothetical protein